MEQRINWDIPILMCPRPPPPPTPSHNFPPPKNDRFLKSGVQNFSWIKPTKFIPFSFSKGANKKIKSSDSSLGWWWARVTDKNGVTHTAVRLIRTLFYCTPDLILYSIVFSGFQFAKCIYSAVTWTTRSYMKLNNFSTLGDFRLEIWDRYRAIVIEVPYLANVASVIQEIVRCLDVKALFHFGEWTNE